MNIYPDSALVQLEFENVKTLLAGYCNSEYAKSRAETLRIHTKKEFIDVDLKQTAEYKSLLDASQYFPNDAILNIAHEIRLLSIPGAMLTEEQLMQVRRLAENVYQVFRWFDDERKKAYPSLATVLHNTQYEKSIIKMIDGVLDESGVVRDNASAVLAQVRLNLFRKRNELRRVFDRVVQKWSKAGYVADIEEAFLNGRRVVALFAENKRQVKGILHGESDTRKTAFVEPEETIELNNDIFSLEQEEAREINRILRELTASLSVYAGLLKTYLAILGEYDFIRAKAKLAVEMKGNFPEVIDKAVVKLVDAFHPLLFLYNLRNNKPTIPTNIHLDEKNRILVISGPNAGGKTVTLKTVGILQLMLQSGLLVPVSPDSTMGIFRQLMIHIGDTQSLEFELSTYSSHLKNMKHFMDNGNGKTLFFIDELGSGSDPNLGGAFAEVILEELNRKHAMGIVTTHYLNLKVMANKTPGIINGAMAFDEGNLLPLYKLIIGKPGSSYTFSIAERIGMDPALINRARKLVEEDHFRLDKLLNSTEQDLHAVEKERKELQRLIKENEKLRRDMENLMNKEKHVQQVELLKQQNRITEDRIAWLKDTERKLKQLVIDWKKTDDEAGRKSLMKQLHALLFSQNQKQVNEKVKKKMLSKFDEVEGDISVGQKVVMKKNHQVGEVIDIRGKKAVVKVGLMPITVELKDLSLVTEKGDN